MSVDVTLLDTLGNELDMPCEFDDFTNKASNMNFNSIILEEIMNSVGFSRYKGEWWHYNNTSDKPIDIVDISREKIENLIDI